MGHFTGEKPQYSGALGLQMLSLWSSFIEPPSVENSVSMLPNCCGEQVRHPRAMEFCEKLQKPKKTRIFGDLVIEITSKSHDMVIICDNYSYPKI